jgi:nicotinamidase/pyrazinamidase
MRIPIQAETDALIIVDLQPDFMPGGALAVAEGDRLVAPIAALLPRFRTIVATQDWHPEGHISFGEWPPHCLQGSPGAALHPDLPLEPLTLVLRKGTRREVDSYSAFRENADARGDRLPTGLAGFLRERGIRRVFVCGLARDFCVRWTAEDAAAAGFETVVLDDLTRAVFPDRAAETHAAFERAGVRRADSADLGTS